MSDIEIRSGAAVAVDTDTLRAAADVCAAFAGRIDTAVHAFDTSQWIMSDVCLVVASDSGAALAAATRALNDDVERMTADLRRAADLYETVELMARLSLGHDAAAQHRLDDLTSRDPSLALFGAAEVAQWADRSEGHLISDLTRAGALLGPLGMVAGFNLARALLTAIAVTAQGPLQPGSRPQGPLPPAKITPTQPPRDGTAPEGLADLMGRIPSGDEERIRVERYEMADGTRTFAVYLAGTREWGFPSADAFDLQANFEAYGGDASASLAAVYAALEEAGAMPGDQIVDVGHSQGAMVGAYLAQDARFDVIGVYTAGAPLLAETPGDTLHVDLVHGDDFVPILSRGGVPGTNGSDSSVFVGRETDLPMTDLPWGPHGILEYLKTAELVDLSDDARLIAMREQFAYLATAENITVFEYGADRVWS